MNLAKTYEPEQYENEIYALWENSGGFAPRGAGEPYSIVMPPPNANGNLHVGHALMIPIEDVLIRYYRMRGRDTLWIPGADHAGFETWVVFERALEAAGKSRFDFSREELYEMTWNFVQQNRGNMELQLRALGASCDWEKSVFTLDQKVVDTVYQTFKRLWDDGLIYRGKRLVNYCTKHQTSFADIEVEFRDETEPLYYLKYGPFTVATTRPETQFGDTAVAVHPDDVRYQKYVGQEIAVESAIGTFHVKVIADEMVDPEFGTGVVKITPAHSFDDFAAGERHDLPLKQVIDQDGKLNENTGEFAGLDIKTAREKVAQKLDELGLIEKVEKNYKTRIGHCYKCGTVIEPMLMAQWFIDVQPLAQKAKTAVEQGKIRFTPAQKARELVRYYDELRDWNISRQIPWGIPIPAFQNSENPEDWIFDTRVDQEGIEVEGKIYRRDNDTFDTWFSSGQWPFVTTEFLRNPETAEEAAANLARFYPNSVMETGVDLLRQWVARMIMLGLYATDDVPFREVFFHGLVLDEHGQKMSKSKGNVINPMDIISKFGSDALRMGIMMNRAAGQPQAFSQATVIAGRNFCNKLWNVARFIEGKIDEEKNSRSTENNLPEISREKLAKVIPETIAEHWIFAKLDAARQNLDSHIKNYRFAEAVETIYHFVWDDLADWFVEASKREFRAEFLAKILELTLRLAHPFAPFLTETIWTTLFSKSELLIQEKWPEKLHFDKEKCAQFAEIQDLVSEIRFVLAELPKQKYSLLFSDDELIAANAALIANLANLEKVEKIATPRGLRLANNEHAAWLDLSSELVYQHQTKLEMRLVDLRKEIATLEKRLANENYVAKAPAKLVDESRAQLAAKKTSEARLVRELDVIEKE